MSVIGLTRGLIQERRLYSNFEIEIERGEK